MYFHLLHKCIKLLCLTSNTRNTTFRSDFIKPCEDYKINKDRVPGGESGGVGKTIKGQLDIIKNIYINK